jgi:predicted RNase H-like HicB family nuclease
MAFAGFYGATGETTMKLHVLIEQDEAGYFVAEVPALPGCLSQGKTREEALSNVKEAIVGWLETMEAKTDLDLDRSVEVMV